MQPRSPLRASLRRRRRALASHLQAAVTGDSHAVHQARVATRRLRETLPVVGAGLESEEIRKVRRRMRRLTRALGAVRELEVAIDMAGGSPDAPVEADTRPGRDHLKAKLQEDLERARAHVTKVLDTDKIDRWLHQVEAVEATLARSRSQAAWRRELATRLEERAARVLAALDEAGVLFAPERLHEVRIALKRLRYALELAGELRIANTAAAVEELKAVQDILGVLHDHDVLMGYAAASAEQPGLDRVTRASLLALHGTLDTERHMLHAQFLARRPALLRLHDRAIDVAARARTQPIVRAQRQKTSA